MNVTIAAWVGLPMKSTLAGALMALAITAAAAKVNLDSANYWFPTAKPTSTEAIKFTLWIKATA
jgi:hypothetical protein